MNTRMLIRVYRRSSADQRRFFHSCSRSRLFNEFGEALGDLVANPAEFGEAVRLVAGGGSGVFQAPVNPAGLGREHGATLWGVVADGDHIVEGLAGKVIDVLGPVGAD